MILHHLPSLIWLFTAATGRHPSTKIPTTTKALALDDAVDFLPPANFRTGGACQESHVIFVDVENLRGKSGFSLSHSDVMTSLTQWSRVCGLAGRLILVVDHGSDASSLWLPDEEYAVVFAGGSQKADDVLALDLVPFFSELPQVTVVTADHDLLQRCRRASGVKQRLHILPPAQLLEDLQSILETMPIVADNEEVDDTELSGDTTRDEAQETTSRLLDYEIKLGAQLLEAEALLRSKRGAASNNKRRGKLKLKAQNLREKLYKARQDGGSMIDRVTDILAHGTKSPSLQTLPVRDQNALLSRWEKIRRSSGRRREQTGDRIILAEQLRRQLLEKSETPSNPTNEATEATVTMPPGKAFVLRHKELMSFVLPKMPGTVLEDDGREVAAAPLNLVVISDTHGMEDDLPLPDGQELLPEGDVLLHLGDFAIDNGPIQEYLQRFDTWLAKQPHRIKIVLRGNHDPKHLAFPISGATVLTQPKSVRIGGYLFYFVPFSRSLTPRAMPRSCDVIVSHVPPRGILDHHYMGGRPVGCAVIRRGVERMKGGPPLLWLCGHIHEGRGSMKHSFVNGNNRETLVINAANANSGRAEFLEHGPVVVNLECNVETGGNKKAQILQMEGQYEYINRTTKSFFEMSDEGGELLLAVDLGLRTGLSLYNDMGKLIRYENFQFDSADDLKNAASRILHEWEADASSSSGSQTWAITRIAIEGGDPPLREAWHQAANGKQALLYVKPEEWRADLLTGKEKLNGENAKAASRLIARQIVADYGDAVLELHDGKFQTDMAESVLLGLHVARRLGWVPAKDPPVRRYTNGGVIVPEKAPRL
jgi:Icc-related predicted phosphoesterase